MAIECDVAVIGGGPAASTLGTLLRRYDRKLKIALIEREVFPRDHVGESLITQLMPILHEMQVWDKVEAAGFPIKLGGLYKWGSTSELWTLDFLGGEFQDQPRPGRYAGQRMLTAFQVDRSIYDEILLDHANARGCMVYEGVKVTSVERDGDRVTGFKVAASDPRGVEALGGESEFKARWYIDASGNSGLLRRTMGVEIDSPTALRNIAVYDYWQNTEWAQKVGVGGTRILTLSIDFGWIWFIPLGPTRTSIGLVMPADHVKKTGKRPEQLYMEAVTSEPTIAKLIANATCEKITQSTKDWSFVSKRLFGENWFLAGDSAGFADPILSAGLTLAQIGARNLAYTLLELDRGKENAGWLKESFQQIQTARIRNHIRFADYWYSANGHFSDLKAYCAEIAKSAGLDLEPSAAFNWMGQGGFAHDGIEYPSAGGYGVSAIKKSIQSISGSSPTWNLEKVNRLRIDIEGACEEMVPTYGNGRVTPVRCLRRGPFVLACEGTYVYMVSALRASANLAIVIERFIHIARSKGSARTYWALFCIAVETLEAMLVEGWVVGDLDPTAKRLGIAIENKRNRFHLGWVREGVGLSSVNPNTPDEIVLSWGDYLALRDSSD